MKLKPALQNSYVFWFMPLTLILSIIVHPDAYAAKSNPETGEKCQGLECVGIETSSNNSGDSKLRLSNVDVESCNELEENKIHFAVDWLQKNLPAIDAQMGRNGLISWPDNSRENFADKLRKDLKFVCISEKNKCDDLLGIVYPVVAQKRINLCTSSIRDNAAKRGINNKTLYVHVVAHEVGHLVRLNKHRNNCAERYTNPRFSQSLGLAAESAYLGVTYDATPFVNGCSPPKTSGQDIIENKLQPPPMTVNKPSN
ncbi:MAG: hypothetical protein L0Z73_08605 [Gammaproteobacteria bacterium]|nr:hypothetical protein [Gammaproteobacteria bacterium]